MQSVSFFGLLLLAVAASANDEVRELQGANATCRGEALMAVSYGCTTPAECMSTATSMGLTAGSEQFDFEGNWEWKGCFYYPSDHPLYPNQAYYGSQGTCSQLRVVPQDGAMRMSCDGSTASPFDSSRCSGDACYTAEACREAALAEGYELGSAEYAFEGDWAIKGCVFFPSAHPEYPGQAYWGTGASICGQLRAEPPDGSVRLYCGTESVTPSPTSEMSMTDEPTAVPVTPEPSVTTAGTTGTSGMGSATVATGAPTFAEKGVTTAPSTEIPVYTAAPTWPRPPPGNGTTGGMWAPDDNSTDFEQEDNGPGFAATVSAFESSESANSAAAASFGVSAGLFFLSAALVFVNRA